MLLGIAAGGVVGGLIYVAARGHTAPSDFAIGVSYGLLISLAIGSLEIFMGAGPLRLWFGSLSFGASLALRSTLYAAVIIPIQYFEIGTIIHGPGIAPSQQSFWAATAFSAVFSVAMNLILGIINLVGRRAFFNFLTGRYHDPVEECRFVLFVDIAGSTRLAQRFGGVGIHRFLDRTFRLLALSATDFRGEVLDYVGDEVIVTWPEKVGAVDCRPLRCFIDMRVALDHAAPHLMREFGAVPKIRGSLHFGSVVIGEIGDIKRAIVFTGDVMNIAARLEELSRETEGGFLVSRAAMERFNAAPPVAVRDLGRMEIRGRSDGIDVFGFAAAG
jgi:adenylate cyclase